MFVHQRKIENLKIRDSIKYSKIQSLESSRHLASRASVLTCTNSEAARNSLPKNILINHYGIKMIESVNAEYIENISSHARMADVHLPACALYILLYLIQYPRWIVAVRYPLQPTDCTTISTANNPILSDSESTLIRFENVSWHTMHVSPSATEVPLARDICSRLWASQRLSDAVKPPMGDWDETDNTKNLAFWSTRIGITIIFGIVATGIFFECLYVTTSKLSSGTVQSVGHSWIALHSVHCGLEFQISAWPS